MAIDNIHKKLAKIGRVVPKMWSRTDKQHTHRQRQTDTLITVLRRAVLQLVDYERRRGATSAGLLLLERVDNVRQRCAHQLAESHDRAAHLGLTASPTLLLTYS